MDIEIIFFVAKVQFMLFTREIICTVEFKSNLMFNDVV